MEALPAKQGMESVIWSPSVLVDLGTKNAPSLKGSEAIPQNLLLGPELYKPVIMVMKEDP